MEIQEILLNNKSIFVCTNKGLIKLDTILNNQYENYFQDNLITNIAVDQDNSHLVVNT